MRRIFKGSKLLFGIDVSHYEPTVDFTKLLKAANLSVRQADGSYINQLMPASFAMAKASDGEHGQDGALKVHRPNAHKAGLVFGGYHFFRFAQDPVRQAHNFMAAMGQIMPGELPPIMDIEWDNSQGAGGKYANGKTLDDHGAAQALACLKELERITGMIPIVYTAASFMVGVKDKDLLKAFARYPLWVANYHVYAPMVNDLWPSWAFWQFTDAQVIAGVPAKVDANFFNGDLGALKALCQKSQADQQASSHVNPPAQDPRSPQEVAATAAAKAGPAQAQAEEAPLSDTEYTEDEIPAEDLGDHHQV